MNNPKTETTKRPQSGPLICGLPTLYMKGDKCITLIAHSNDTNYNQYNIYIRPEGQKFKGTFYINAKPAFELVANSYKRAFHMMIAATSAYLNMNRRITKEKRARKIHEIAMEAHARALAENNAPRED